MEKVLVIEDDRATHKALKHLFESEGFAVEVARDGAAGLEAFRASSPILVILDLRLPVIPGQDVCREIRKDSPLVPIIVLTAAPDEVDKVLLLELGADDYVTKPFSPRELLARGRAVLRRSRRNTAVSVQFRRYRRGFRQDGTDARWSAGFAYSSGTQGAEVFRWAQGTCDFAPRALK